MKVEAKLGLKVGLFLVACSLGLWGILVLESRRQQGLAEHGLRQVHGRIGELGLPLTSVQYLEDWPSSEDSAHLLFQAAEEAFLQAESWQAIDDNFSTFDWPLATTGGSQPDQTSSVLKLLPEFDEAITLLSAALYAGPSGRPLPDGAKLGDFESDDQLFQALTISSILARTASRRIAEGEYTAAWECVEAAFGLAESRRLGLSPHSDQLFLSFTVQAAAIAMRVLPLVEDPMGKLASIPRRGEFLTSSPPAGPVSLVEEFERNLIWFREAMDETGVLREEYSDVFLLRGRTEYLEHYLQVLDAVVLPGPHALAEAERLDARVTKSDNFLLKLQAPQVQSRLRFYLTGRSTCLLLLLGTRALGYQQEHGAWPASLSDFAEGFPLDPLTNKPFLLEISPGGIRLSSPAWGVSEEEGLTWLLESGSL